MTTQQSILFALLFAVFGMLIWGRIRYDVVAFSALIAGVILGVVPEEHAFDGFGHHATIIIALVLIISRALSKSGAIELVARHLIDSGRSLFSHIAIMSAVAAGLSAIMNNVAALALLMPMDIQTAQKAKRSPALTLMPLSFASILGGMITLIGTPPNIIIASYRAEALGQPYHMFDFAPVGLVTAAAGIAFIALIGWRLIPASRTRYSGEQDGFDVNNYIAELRVPEDSRIIGKKVAELDDEVEEAGATIMGLVRRGEYLPGRARRAEIRKGDILVIEADAKAIDELVGALQLEYIGTEKHEGLTREELSLAEVVIPEDARAVGRSEHSLRLHYRRGVALLGISRQGKFIRERVRKIVIEPGDVLLLLGPKEQLDDTINWLGALPLKQRDLQVIQRNKAWIATGIFAAAIIAASFGILGLPIALGLASIGMILLKIIPLRELYDSVEWPVIVLIASMIPLGTALETTGGTALIADQIIRYSADYGPVAVLTFLMIVTMSLSDVLNNTATAVIAAPIAIDIAHRLQVSPDPFLMAVAVAASCAFLTPIGHKNNTLILGPGGYRFGDYWRMGLPLEILVVVVSIPMILVVWPF
ncbi:MAG: SLC13 family permease [Gammaproteobacteria bacterium]|nr:MAG: SLC13 family permease [Gammaproteobacteria bacterium]